MTDLAPIDYASLAISRLAYQFKESPNLRNFILITINQGQQIQNALFDLLNKRDLDTAEGAQLDVIGRIVGQNRTLINATELAFFTFDDLFFPQTNINEGFGDLNDNSVGGYFIYLGQNTDGNVVLPDNMYRLFIRVKILKNFTDSSPEKLIQILKFIYGDSTIIYVSEFTAFTLVGFSRRLDKNEKSLLKVVDSRGRRLIPKTVGTGIGFYDSLGNDAFSFFEDPYGKGFSDVNNPLVGGVFASLIL